MPHFGSGVAVMPFSSTAAVAAPAKRVLEYIQHYEYGADSSIAITALPLHQPFRLDASARLLTRPMTRYAFARIVISCIRCLSYAAILQLQQRPDPCLLPSPQRENQRIAASGVGPLNFDKE